MVFYKIGLNAANNSEAKHSFISSDSSNNNNNNNCYYIFFHYDFAELIFVLKTWHLVFVLRELTPRSADQLVFEGAKIPDFVHVIIFPHTKCEKSYFQIL